MQRFALYLFLFVLVQLPISDLRAQLPRPSPSAPDFKERPFGPVPPPTPTPMRKKIEPPAEPIPKGWIIAGIAVVALGVAAFLYGSARQWHSENLFDRQYRFPRNKNVAARFGAKRCGGHLATVRFEISESKDT